MALESTRLAAREIEGGELAELGPKTSATLALAVHFVGVRHSDRAGLTVEASVQ